MASKDTCNAVLQFGDDTFQCDLPAGHDAPTDAAPQGEPHRDTDQVDSLTHSPRTWWGPPPTA